MVLEANKTDAPYPGPHGPTITPVTIRLRGRQTILDYLTLCRTQEDWETFLKRRSGETCATAVVVPDDALTNDSSATTTFFLGSTHPFGHVYLD